MKRLIAVFRLVRLPNTFTAWADIVLGFVLISASTSHPDRGGKWAMFLPMIVSTLIYWAGFVLNDIFDLERDREEFPSRPLPAGEISCRFAGVLAAVLIIAALAVSSLRIQTLAVAAALVGAVFLYNGLAKKTVAGPLVMGLCRFLNVLLGASAVGVFSLEEFAQVAPPAAAVMFFVMCLTFWSRSERRQAKASDGIAALVCLNISFAIAVYWWGESGRCHAPSIGALCVAFVAVFNYLAIRTLLAGRPEEYNRTLKLGLSAITVYDGLLVTAVVGPAGLLLWLLVLPNLALRRYFSTT